MKNRIIILIGTSLFLFSGLAQSWTMPYEQCRWTNEDYTTRIVQEGDSFQLFTPDMETGDPVTDGMAYRTQGRLQVCDIIPGQESFMEYSTLSPEAISLLEIKCNGFPNIEQNSADACWRLAIHLHEREKLLMKWKKDLLNCREFVLEEQESRLEESEPQDEIDNRGFFTVSNGQDYEPQNPDLNFSEDIPVECFFASTVRGANLYEAGEEQFAYCEKDSKRPGNMELIDDQNRQRFIFPRRACLNEDYTELTARAFNETADCFGFNREAKEDIFRLFNHESSFLHNIKSSEGAKCYGQLTGIAIEEINTQIYFRDMKEPHPYSHIYEDVIKECPNLKSKVLNTELTKTREELGGKSFDRLKEILKKTPISCKLTQDPYACLFYAFYNIRLNILAIGDLLSKSSSYPLEEQGISQALIEQFHLPIKLNEMLVVTADHLEKTLVFLDDEEVVPVLKKPRKEKIESFSAKKVSLFANEEEVQELFSHWAYNGGISIATDHMEDFIKRMKESISKACSIREKCPDRFSIIEGNGLATDDVRRKFRAYLGEKYEPNGTKAGFLDDINENMKYLHNEKSDFRGHLKNLIPSLEDYQIEDFQEYVKEVCPKPL